LAMVGRENPCRFVPQDKLPDLTQSVAQPNGGWRTETHLHLASFMLGAEPHRRQKRGNPVARKPPSGGGFAGAHAKHLSGRKYDRGRRKKLMLTKANAS